MKKDTTSPIEKVPFKDILKGIWKLFPFRWIINILARVFIGSATISVLEIFFTGNILVPKIIINLWIFMPIYDFIRYSYHRSMGCQSWRTILLNDLYDSFYKLEKSTKNRIKQTKLRIWVQKNPEIHLFNYWYLKILRKKEWMNINVDKLVKVKI